MIKFIASDVTPSSNRLSTTTHRQDLEKLVESPLEALCFPGIKTVKAQGFHALIEAIHLAFAHHFPLSLKPDNIFVVINQGFATHINQNAEQYRGKFVSHEGKQEIEIYRPDFIVGSPDNNWPSAFDQFSNEIKARIGEDNHSRFTAKFSTTGPVSRTVSQIVLMDVVQSYFTYVVTTECGIPSITLDGTPEDWQTLRDHVAALKEYGGLDWWIDSLVPIMDQFVAASRGNVDREFWQGIYHAGGFSGHDSVNGWVAKLFPYTKKFGQTVRNPVLTEGASGLGLSDLPSAISNVPFLFDGAPYQFIGGHTAVIQEGDGTVRPAFGWAVRPAPADSTKTDTNKVEPVTCPGLDPDWPGTGCEPTEQNDDGGLEVLIIPNK